MTGFSERFRASMLVEISNIIQHYGLQLPNPDYPGLATEIIDEMTRVYGIFADDARSNRLSSQSISTIVHVLMEGSYQLVVGNIKEVACEIVAQLEQHATFPPGRLHEAPLGWVDESEVEVVFRKEELQQLIDLGVVTCQEIGGKRLVSAESYQRIISIRRTYIS